MIAAAAALVVMGSSVGRQLADVMRSGLTIPRDNALDPSFLLQAFSTATRRSLTAIAPVLACTLFAAVAAPLALGGWTFSASALAPRFARLNPVSGLSRMFAPTGLIELSKAIAKFLVVALVGYIVLRHQTNALLSLGGEPLGQAIIHACTLCGSALLCLVAAMILIAAVDVPYQLWRYNRDLRMTRDEVRREAREQDGSPELKGRIRTLQRERARNRMMRDVPTADVVVVNPTHYSVALRYDDRKMRAPIVVAKGVDLVAAHIREVATEHEVPILEAPPLARALYRSVEIGGEIPASLYVAVAQALTYIFQLRSAQRDHTQPPEPPVIDVEQS
jgi:flagellar biosynthetic protein FlhB